MRLSRAATTTGASLARRRHPKHLVNCSAEVLALAAPEGNQPCRRKQRAIRHFGVDSLDQLGLDTATPSRAASVLASSKEGNPGSVSTRKPLST